MTTFTAIVLYLLIWWVVIFCVLPLNIESITDTKTGNMPGAPVNPGLKKKIILTTVIAFLVWLAVCLAIRYSGISFREIAEHMPQ